MTNFLTTSPKRLYSVICGSHAYGTNTPTSDIDYGHVLLEPKEYLFGIADAPSIPQQVGEVDVNQHWLQRFVNLCTKCNPNALEWLFVSKDKILDCHPLFEKYIRSNRSMFLSLRNVSASHFGFAKAQIEKMTRHEKKMGDARRQLVEKYGYDVKYAAHALRLMWQLNEFLASHYFEVTLPYEKEIQKSLKEIKSGQVAYEVFMKWYEREVTRIGELVEKNRFQMPLEPNKEKINDLLIGFYEEYYYAELHS